MNKYFNETPIYLAIEKENIDIVKLLLSNENIDVNKKNIFYLTQCSSDIKIEIPTIYLATQKENYEIVKLLLMNDKIDTNMMYEYKLFGADCCFV